MALPDTIARAANVYEWIGKQTVGMSTTGGDRVRIALAGFDQVDEHARAMNYLLEAKDNSFFPGTALSLMRSLFETFIRAQWILRCATDEQVKRFQQDIRESIPDMASLVRDLEKNPDVGCGVLQRVKDQGWSRLCDFAHGGFQLLVRRMNGPYIGIAHDDEELVVAVQFSASLAIACAFEQFRISDRSDLAAAVADKLDEL
jgi:hypothetical protein